MMVKDEFLPNESKKLPMMKMVSIGLHACKMCLFLLNITDGSGIIARTKPKDTHRRTPVFGPP
jgi:hypothetical protein